MMLKLKRLDVGALIGVVGGLPAFWQTVGHGSLSSPWFVGWVAGSAVTTTLVLVRASLREATEPRSVFYRAERSRGTILHGNYSSAAVFADVEDSQGDVIEGNWHEPK